MRQVRGPLEMILQDGMEESWSECFSSLEQTKEGEERRKGGARSQLDGIAGPSVLAFELTDRPAFASNRQKSWKSPLLCPPLRVAHVAQQPCFVGTLKTGYFEGSGSGAAVCLLTFGEIPRTINK